jgi:lysine 2,3-aminomutase
MSMPTLQPIRTDPGAERDTLNSDWRWQLRHAVRDETGLHGRLGLRAEQLGAVSRANQRGFGALITPYYLGLCDPHDPNCPIRLQCIPTVHEQQTVVGELEDPLGEQAHLVAPHLVRRYPDRALLIVTGSCAVHCRFCTRSRVLRHRRGAVPLRDLEPAVRWLASHSEVREVLVSGGDPLTLSTARLLKILQPLRSIEHIEVIRVGTRVPVALPMRVDGPLVAALRAMRPLWVMTHFNHGRELTAQARRAVEMLVEGGIPVMNQTVLLKNINDDAQVLAALFRGLVCCGVKPYYLLHADCVRGTWHLRTSLQRSVQLFSELQAGVSGLAVPKLVVDTPGGHGKVSLGPEAIVGVGSGRTTVRTFRGQHVDIIDPPDGQSR